jgi:DUF4097 and DUF4098 domain-containing protein YvlB
MKVGYLKITAALSMLVAASAIAAESVDKSWDLDAKANVSIENIAGSIEIEGWNKNEARLTGTLGRSVDELEISASGSRLEISVINRGSRNIDSTELKLMVPKGASVDATAVSADIDVLDLDNEKLTASSVSGNVAVKSASKRVSIESVSGDVKFSGHTERVSAESVSGDIDLSDISGEISATTVSGDIELNSGPIENAKLETVSGDMTVVAEISDNGKLTAESMSGDVVIGLPSSQSGAIKAESFSGRIHTDFGSVEKNRHGPGNRLVHTIGSGGAEIRVETFSGNVKLKHD